MEEYNKIVRDNIPTIIENSGSNKNSHRWHIDYRTKSVR